MYTARLTWPSHVRQICLSPDFTFVLIDDGSSTVRAYEPVTMSLMASVTLSGPVHQMTCTSTAKFVALTARGTGTVTLWDVLLQSVQDFQVLHATDDPPVVTIVNHDTAVVVATNFRVDVVTIEYPLSPNMGLMGPTIQFNTRPTTHPVAVPSPMQSPMNMCFAFGRRGSATLYEFIPTKSKLLSVRFASYDVPMVCFSPDGMLLVVVNRASPLVIVCVPDVVELEHMALTNTINQICISPDSQRVGVLTDDGGVLVWTRSSGTVDRLDLSRLEPYFGQPLHFFFTASRLLVCTTTTLYIVNYSVMLAESTIAMPALPMDIAVTATHLCIAFADHLAWYTWTEPTTELDRRAVIAQVVMQHRRRQRDLIIARRARMRPPTRQERNAFREQLRLLIDDPDDEPLPAGAITRFM
jgi:hypothetical protein